MIKQRPRAHSTWTEEELRADIHRIDALLRRSSSLRDERSRCATSYLKQLLRDREENLADLRMRREPAS